jgi:hypothetical protein
VGEVWAKPITPFTVPVIGAVPQAWLIVPDCPTAAKTGC